MNIRGFKTLFYYRNVFSITHDNDYITSGKKENSYFTNIYEDAGTFSPQKSYTPVLKPRSF